MAPLGDSDPDKWIYKKHTYAKHELLHYYLTTWTSIVSNPNYSLRIFDCFAGRSSYTDTEDTEPFQLRNIKSDTEIPGSPHIILDAVSKHQSNFSNADCYFLEPNPTNRKLLKEELSNTEVPDNVNATAKNAKFPDDIRQLIVDTGGRSAFSFFFIDPFNVKFLDYETICTITGTPKFESLITLMTEQLLRWKTSETHQPGYQTLFGTEYWKEELDQFVPENMIFKEAEYYTERLEKNGPNYTLPYIVKEGNSPKLKYHLIFTTNAKRGFEKMRESMYRVGTKYTLAFAPQDGKISGGQTKLTGPKFITEDQAAKSWLLTKFEGEVVTLDEIMKVASLERTHESSLRKDYRHYLKELADKQKIRVSGRKPGGPLPDDREIMFPES